MFACFATPAFTFQHEKVLRSLLNSSLYFKRGSFFGFDRIFAFGRSVLGSRIFCFGQVLPFMAMILGKGSNCVFRCFNFYVWQLLAKHLATNFRGTCHSIIVISLIGVCHLSCLRSLDAFSVTGEEAWFPTRLNEQVKVLVVVVVSPVSSPTGTYFEECRKIISYRFAETNLFWPRFVCPEGYNNLEGICKLFKIKFSIYQFLFKFNLFISSFLNNLSEMMTLSDAFYCDRNCQTKTFHKIYLLFYSP